MGGKARRISQPLVAARRPAAYAPHRDNMVGGIAVGIKVAGTADAPHVYPRPPELIGKDRAPGFWITTEEHGIGLERLDPGHDRRRAIARQRPVEPRAAQDRDPEPRQRGPVGIRQTDAREPLVV